MSMGINKKCQIGEETTYGTLASATKNLNYLSESIQLTVNKAVEDTLLAAKAVAGYDITDYAVAGDISLNLKPEDAAYVFAMVMGKEANVVLKASTTGVYDHEMTGAETTDYLPSTSIIVDRGAAIKAYTGCQADKLAISAKAKETLKATLSVKGKSEVTGTINGALTLPALAAFRFIGGTVEFDDVAYGKIDSVDWSYSNSLEEGFYTLDSGMYPERHEHGLKVSEISINALYDTTTEEIREDNYKEGAYVKVEFTFESSAEIETGEPYTIKVTMPKVQITEATANIGGKERIMISLKGTATGNGGSEPVTVNVYDATNAKVF